MSLVDSLVTRLSAALDRGGREPRRGSLHDAVLLRDLEQAIKSAADAQAAGQALGAVSAQQKSAIDGAADRARLLRARAQEAKGTVQRTQSALEQIKLIALNTGLEGARQGEARGRALVQIAEEIRSSAAAALEALSEIDGLRATIDQEQRRLADDLKLCQERSAELSAELLRAQAAARAAGGTLDELSRNARRTARTDPETARLLADVSDHARALLSALTELSTQRERGILMRALAPTLRPLLRVLSELERRGDRED